MYPIEAVLLNEDIFEYYIKSTRTCLTGHKTGDIFFISCKTNSALFKTVLFVNVVAVSGTLWSMKPEHYHYSTIIAETCSALLILLFVYTGVSKFMDVQRFRIVVSQSPLIGDHARIVSFILPIAELATAALLFFPVTRKWGLIASFSLMLLFTIYVGYMIAFTPHLPCSCGGVIKKLSWREHLVFNLFFTGIAAAGLWFDKKNKILVAISRSSRIPVR